MEIALQLHRILPYSYRASVLALCLVLLLTVSVGMAGCNLAWVTTISNIIVAAAPALIDILNIIDMARGIPVDPILEAKIQTDAQAIKTLAGNFAAAPAGAAPSVCMQLETSIATYAADEAQVVAGLSNITNAAVLAKIQSLSSLVLGAITTILSLVPNCSQAATMRESLEKTSPPMSLNNFVKSFNAMLTTPTGLPVIDIYTHRHQIHVHPWWECILTFGFLC